MSTTTCRSNVVERIRKTLLNYDLEIERVRSEIAYRDEIMDFNALSTSKKALKAFSLAKIEKENYQVFLKRLLEQKKDLLKRVGLVAKKYEGEYADIFSMYFFEKKSVEEISVALGIKPKSIEKAVKRMQFDIIDNKKR